ncbi:type II toxin-antitoxin system VapC family toxin [Kutzneria sp. 744]|uniref:type II toxin-antitoxin system VapC family toxin n=1 Tax=Kutzneria sp. (strain 744) TaxID=345341 RepID=UPI0003EEBB27|nr:type II toxin-antitoxin system VapC family toxin [Kutzneria sp. 744]EWM16357.1 toxin-antitoxin system, toxin component, PIN family [Kutzneria sp. 744]
MSHLLDTNVLSELRKKQPDPGVLDWFATVRASELFVSVLVIGEIRQGVDRLARKDPAQADVFDQWLGQLTAAYEDRIVPITTEIAEEWGRLNVPNRLPVVDGLLAATALVRDWTLVTRNTADVEPTGVRLLNPFGAHVSKR